MPYVCVSVSASELNPLSTSGKVYFSKKGTEKRFCRKCKSAFYHDSRKTIGGVYSILCCMCVIDFVADNRSLDEF